MSDIGSMEKTQEQYFRDWEANALGFGYGSGEPHVIPALARFFNAMTDDGKYDYRELEAAVGPVPAWLFINLLCRHDIIEYGTSPRFAWLTKRGKNLKAFFDARTDDELLAAVERVDDEYNCYPEHCNCDDGVRCINPFWKDVDGPAA